MAEAMDLVMPSSIGKGYKRNSTEAAEVLGVPLPAASAEAGQAATKQANIVDKAKANAKSAQKRDILDELIK